MVGRLIKAPLGALEADGHAAAEQGDRAEEQVRVAAPRVDVWPSAGSTNAGICDVSGANYGALPPSSGRRTGHVGLRRQRVQEAVGLPRLAGSKVRYGAGDEVVAQVVRHLAAPRDRLGAVKVLEGQRLLPTAQSASQAPPAHSPTSLTPSAEQRQDGYCPVRAPQEQGQRRRGLGVAKVEAEPPARKLAQRLAQVDPR